MGQDGTSYLLCAAWRLWGGLLRVCADMMSSTVLPCGGATGIACTHCPWKSDPIALLPGSLDLLAVGLMLKETYLPDWIVAI